jgi:molecular chaperone DnaK (HSP70)
MIMEDYNNHVLLGLARPKKHILVVDLGGGSPC